MLVLHPSSRCDVCMDAYSWQTIAQTPHAIPCGHIFCRPCLFALSPLICPLCRKRFDPSKAKRLHVDRPETVDENRENDLLQRMALSAEAPEDQLQELLNEVDIWLDSRADDTCLVLRQARATLTRYLELKKLGPTLEGALADIHSRFQDMTLAYYEEHRERSKLEADNSAMIRENEDLKAEVMELRTVSEQHGYRRNPLPPPPQPVPNEYVPSFAQAMAHDRPFKVQGHKYHKGKAKSLDHRLISPSQIPPPLPTQQAKMDLSEESPALISHLDRHSPSSRQHPPTSTPPSGLKLHFENTNQPLDAYELTQTYLREYSQGVLDGQLMAGKRHLATHQPRASTSRIHNDVSLHDRNESIDARSIRSTRSNRGTQPVSGPSMVDTPYRPLHLRHNTVSSIAPSDESSNGSGSQAYRPPHQRHNTVSSSIVDSVESSFTGMGSQARSSSGSIPRSNPSLAELLSDNVSSAPPPRRPVPSLPTSPPNSDPNPIPSQPQPSNGQLESLSFTRPNSPASSRLSKASTWGTFRSTSTNHTIYSLLGLRDFRESFAVPSGSRVGLQRLSQYSLNSWHGSTSSLSPVSQTQDQFSSSNGFYYEGENENVVRRDDELVNPSYSRDSTGSRQRSMEPQRMTRGRNQPLPALSPSSFSYGEAIITEEDNVSNSNIVTFGNALGLELSTGSIPISAPTPVVPHRTFLRSFSDEA